MANDSKKVSQLGITTALANTDRVVVLTNPAASAQTQTITLANLGKSLTTNAIPIANSTQLGIVKIGSGLAVAANGVVSLNSPAATNSVLGSVKIGSNINVTTDGVISVNSLSIANSSVLGGVKIGSGIRVDGSGVISAVIPNTNIDYIGYMLTTNSAGNAEWSRFTGVYEVIKVDQSGQTTYTVTDKESVLLVNPAVVGGDVTITFPIASAIEGKEILVKLLDSSTGHKVVVTTQDTGNAYLEDPITGAFVTSYDLIDTGQAETWIHDGTVYRHLSTARATPIFYTNGNTYSQVVIKNANGGMNASSDLVLYNDVGNEVAGTGPFIDIGIESSTYSNSQYTMFGPNDAYVYTGGANILIGSDSDKAIKFFANGTASTDQRMIINSTAVAINSTSTSWVFNANGALNFPGLKTIIANGDITLAANGSIGSEGGFRIENATTVTANTIIISNNIYDEILRPLLNPNALDINADGGTSTSVFAIRDEAFTGGGSTTVFGRYEAALDGGFSFNNRHNASYIDGGGANVL